MQVTTQESGQARTQFKPGRSGNPSGMSRTERVYREMVAVFESIHSRKPNRVEVASLRNAAALSARIEGNRIPATEIVRAGNLLARLVEKLGLDRTPDPAAPHVPLRERLAKSPLQELQEHCERVSGGKP